MRRVLRKIPKPRDPILFSLTVIALLSVAVSWRYFSRGQSVADSLGGRQAVKAELIMQSDTPGVKGKSIRRSISTENPGEIRELTAIMERYPHNRKISFPPKFFTEPTTMMWANLACAPQDGKTVWTQELVYSDGYMQAAVSDGYLFRCGVGHLGTSRTKKYFTELQNFYQKKAKSMAWGPEFYFDPDAPNVCH